MAAVARKGPWMEEEDGRLVFFVRLFGERRWDNVAKVSGLKRSGKSCRLRWVNYLHPGLKHGRLTPQEQHLVIRLHAKWGNRFEYNKQKLIDELFQSKCHIYRADSAKINDPNTTSVLFLHRWSRIARCLPGRTDNEIKNYWRTHMRKKAEELRMMSSPSSSSSLSSQPSSSNSEVAGLVVDGDGYSMDQLWDEISASENSDGTLSVEGDKNGGCSSKLEDCSESALWEFDDEELQI